MSMLHIRKYSFDQIIFNTVVRENEYRLPEQFDSEDVIIDIGAHIGIFAQAALERGAGLIYAVEPDKTNFELAASNLAPFIEQERVRLFNAAVWRSDSKACTLYHSGYIETNGILNTGGGDVLWSRQGEAVGTISLDALLTSATRNGRRRLRLLKIDCEGSEWPILLTSRRLKWVDAICGEFHEIGGDYDSLQAPFAITGYRRFTLTELDEFLTQQGFVCSFERSRNPDGSTSRLGLFFAWRADGK